jgi:hypothetical protein
VLPPLHCVTWSAPRLHKIRSLRMFVKLWLALRRDRYTLARQRKGSTMNETEVEPARRGSFILVLSWISHGSKCLPPYFICFICTTLQHTTTKTRLEPMTRGARTNLGCGEADRPTTC